MCSCDLELAPSADRSGLEQHPERGHSPPTPALSKRGVTGAAAMENGMEVPQKRTAGTTTCSSNPTSGHFYSSKENGIAIMRRRLHPHVYCSTIHNRQDIKTTRVSIDRWIKISFFLSLSLSFDSFCIQLFNIVFSSEPNLKTNSYSA